MHRKKFVLNEDQRRVLEDFYEKTTYASAEKRNELADILNIKERQVKAWFKNRRSRDTVRPKERRRGRRPKANYKNIPIDRKKYKSVCSQIVHKDSNNDQMNNSDESRSRGTLINNYPSVEHCISARKFGSELQASQHNANTIGTPEKNKIVSKNYNLVKSPIKRSTTMCMSRPADRISGHHNRASTAARRRLFYQPTSYMQILPKPSITYVASLANCNLIISPSFSIYQPNELQKHPLEQGGECISSSGKNHHPDKDSESANSIAMHTKNEEPMKNGHEEADDDQLVCCICQYKTENSMEMTNHMQSHVQRKAKKKIDDQQDDNTASPKNGSNQLEIDSPNNDSENVPVKKESKDKGIKLLQLVNKLKLNVSTDNPYEIANPSQTPDNRPTETSTKIDLSIEKPNLTIVTAEKTPEPKLQGSPSQRNTSGKRSFECDVCGYKAKWSSELQKHKLVHTNEKPFPCPHCSHRSRWKGDLTRHIQKIHKIFVQPQRSRKSAKSTAKDKPPFILPAGQSPLLVDTLPTSSNNNFVAFPGMSPLESKASSTPPDHQNLAHTQSKTPSPNKKTSILIQKLNSEPIHDMGKGLNFANKRTMDIINGKESPSPKNGETVVKKMVYKCKECDFYTKTASRFHVHVVQHLNKKPYMCSDCGYRSNWQWDVTKHIRVKVGKMNCHKSAEVLLIDEAGEKNYEKYKPYMEFIEEIQPTTKRNATSVFDIEKRKDPEKDAVVSDLNKKFKCTECAYQADEFEQLRRHAVSHLANYLIENNVPQSENKDLAYEAGKDQNGDTIFLCSKCPYKSRKSELISFHVLQHSPRSDAPHQCLFCPYWVQIERNLIKHMSLHVTDISSFLDELRQLVAPRDGPSPKQIKLSCDQCSFSCTNHADLDAHKQTHDIKEILTNVVKPENKTVKMFKCRFCPLMNKQKKNILTHEMVHTKMSNFGENSSEETPMEEVYIDEESINNNSVIDENFILFKCSSCPNIFISAKNLLIHEKLHGSNRQYKCDQCNYATNYKQHQEKHISGHLSNKDTINDYDQESENTTIVNNIKSSQPKSTTKRQPVHSFRCTNCPAKFSKSIRLRRHQALHGANGKFTCMICLYSVNNSIAFQKHKQLHNEAPALPEAEAKDMYPKKLSSVNVKAKSMDNREWLQQSAEHVKIEKEHMGGRLFSCTFCPYIHHRKDAVQNHLRRHVQQSGAFQCSFCDYNVLYDSFLRDHLKIHFGMSQHFSPKFKNKFSNFEISATSIESGEKEVIFRHRVADDNDEFYPDIPMPADGETVAKDDTAANEEHIRQLLADTTAKVANDIENVNGVSKTCESPEGQTNYMNAMKDVKNIADVYSVINEYLHSGGSIVGAQDDDKKPKIVQVYAGKK